MMLGRSHLEDWRMLPNGRRTFMRRFPLKWVCRLAAGDSRHVVSALEMLDKEICHGGRYRSRLRSVSAFIEMFRTMLNHTTEILSKQARTGAQVELEITSRDLISSHLATVPE